MSVVMLRQETAKALAGAIVPVSVAGTNRDPIAMRRMPCVIHFISVYLTCWVNADPGCANA